jgi:hypothetical protein
MRFRAFRQGSPISAWSLVAVFALAHAAAGQVPLEPGARIRIRPAYSPSNVVGTLLFLDRDSLVIGAKAAPRPVSITTLAWIDVSEGKRRHAARGAFIGAVAGAVSALLYNAAAHAGCVARCPEKTKSAAVFALGGASAGAALGYFIRTDRWSRMHLAPRVPTKRNPPDRADFHGS